MHVDQAPSPFRDRCQSEMMRVTGADGGAEARGPHSKALISTFYWVLAAPGPVDLGI
jgi:hypothetical protein